LIVEKNPHIIFVYPPASSTAHPLKKTHFKLCLGSAYIISYLVQQGFSARQFLAEEPINVKECAARILAGKPKTIGFTVDNANYFLCRLIAGVLKEMDPNVIIIFGGIMPSIHPGTILKNNPFVDICSRNESEETCLELLSRLNDACFDLKKASLETVKGIAVQTGGEIFNTPERKVFFTNRHTPDFLDKYPSPYLSGIAASAKMGIITARGCNQHCIFCICPTLSGRATVTHSTDRVIEELDYIAKNLIHDDVPVVDIFDDTFTLIPGRALEICRKIIENKIKLPLACITRSDRINEELLDTLKEAGFKSLEFSLESAVPRILRVIGKVRHPNTKIDPDFEKEKEFIDTFKRYIVYAKKIGIESVITSIMLGLPTETREEGQQTIDLIQSLYEHYDFYAHNAFQVFPGTATFSTCETCGIKLEPCDDQVHYKTIHPYDVKEIPLAPKADVVFHAVKKDQYNIKILGFSIPPKDKINVNSFERVILCADIITKELVLWLREYLAVNGTFIHIYAGFEEAECCHPDNQYTLEKYASPTSYYVAYYQSHKEDGMSTLTPVRTHYAGKLCGLTINLVDTYAGVPGSRVKINPLQSICIDREKEDTHRLVRGFPEFCPPGAVEGNLFDVPVYPHLSSLCRWENQGKLANCKTLETVIIDRQNNIKTCWNGESVGRVGMPLPGILANLENLHKESENQRDCKNCVKQPVCMKCIFPAPLPGEEYCNLKRDFPTEKAAEMIRTVDFFKELTGSKYE